MKKRVFITGTDTDVGKTIVTRAIVRALVNRGKSVVALKPVESGVPLLDGVPAPADALALKKASRSRAEISDICCYTFSDPVSPHLAAKRDGKRIEVGPILNMLSRKEKETDILIAEGAGGLMVPLSDDLIYADLIASSGYSLLIVAPNRLGTINSTLLTIEAARSRDIDVLGVVLNRTPASEFGNGDAISQYGDVPIIGYFPDCADNDDVLGITAERTLDLSIFDEGEIDG